MPIKPKESLKTLRLSQLPTPSLAIKDVGCFFRVLVLMIPGIEAVRPCFEICKGISRRTPRVVEKTDAHLENPFIGIPILLGVIGDACCVFES